MAGSEICIYMVLFPIYSVFPGDCAEGFWCKSGARVRSPQDGESGLPCPAGHYCPEGRGALEQHFPPFLEILGAISSACCDLTRCPSATAVPSWHMVRPGGQEEGAGVPALSWGTLLQQLWAEGTLGAVQPWVSSRTTPFAWS